MSVKLLLSNQLDIVKHDDQIVVENVASVILSLGKEYAFHDFDIKKHDSGYVMSVKTSPHASISLVDMQLIKDCNPIRVQDVYVNVIEGVIRVNVIILNSGIPVVITDTDVIRVKKRKIWNIFQRA